MAIHAHSTTAPTVQPRLLRGGGTVPCRVLTTDELLDEIRLTIEEQVLGQLDAKPELAPEGLLPPSCKSAAKDFNGLAFHEDTPICPAAGQTQHGVGFDLPGSGDLKSEIISDMAADQIAHCEHFAEHARALHMRRELHQALDYGFALLDALDLPPLGLDVIDDAIATLDALEAPDEDREEDDTAEAEPDDEEGGDLEAVDEDGDPLDLGEHDGWRRPRRARVANTEWPVAMAEREGQRAVVIAAVVTSPNVVRFPGSGPL